ncbi:hypothetical protein LP419_15160 [Massilia sp. H-1]|nr:hypothetical protein LP419_15160 [Massilia sp. H-1]
MEAKMRLDAEATLARQLVQIKQASISAGRSVVRLTGNASLAGNREFKASASATGFNPASFGDYPAADVNADINVNGFLACKPGRSRPTSRCAPAACSTCRCRARAS